MKTKTINAVLCKKFDEFVESITDLAVQKLVRENTIITGGCIASMLLKEKVNDYDIYFTNKETVKAVSEYYVKKFNHANNDDGYVLDGEQFKPEEINQYGIAMNMTPDRIKIIFNSKGVGKEKGLTNSDELQELENSEELKAIQEELNNKDKPKYRPVFLTCNAITLSHQIQIIIRFYGNPEEIHGNYDFVHCTNYWSSAERKLYINQPALESLLSKELIYVGSKYPIASMIRIRKFIKRNWTINAGQMLKIAFQISKLDLNKIHILEDQLTGVDVAYFYQLIDALGEQMKRDKEEGRTFTYDYSYLATIIDKIF